MGFTRDSSKHVKSHKDVPFGVIRLKFNVNPLFYPPKHHSLALNCIIGALKSKLPLITIVAP